MIKTKYLSLSFFAFIALAMAYFPIFAVFPANADSLNKTQRKLITDPIAQVLHKILIDWESFDKKIIKNEIQKDSSRVRFFVRKANNHTFAFGALNGLWRSFAKVKLLHLEPGSKRLTVFRQNQLEERLSFSLSHLVSNNLLYFEGSTIVEFFFNNKTHGIFPQEDFPFELKNELEGWANNIQNDAYTNGRFKLLVSFGKDWLLYKDPKGISSDKIWRPYYDLKDMVEVLSSEGYEKEAKIVRPIFIKYFSEYRARHPMAVSEHPIWEAITLEELKEKELKRLLFERDDSINENDMAKVRIEIAKCKLNIRKLSGESFLEVQVPSLFPGVMQPFFCKFPLPA